MDARLLVRGKRFSSICAIDFSGIVDVFTTKGSVNADIFCDFIERKTKSLKVQQRSLMISFYRDFVPSQQMIARVTLSMQDM